MTEAPLSTRKRLSYWHILGVLAVAIAGFFVIRNLLDDGSSAAVYSVDYRPPSGWVRQEPGPLTYFLFKHPDGKAFIRASVNEVHSGTNPTPELDTDGLADSYLKLTHAKQPGWKAQRLEDITSPTERFSLIRRTRNGRTVFTAFCAKGNSTLIVSLSAGDEHAGSVEEHLPVFRQVIDSIRLTRKQVDLGEE